MKLIKIIAFCLLTVAIASCRKAEFMPVPEGAAIPHTDITITLKEVLAASKYTLFKAAWERSDMNTVIKEKGNKTPFTLLVPTDEAFIADGLTLDVINKTTPALLDSILFYHTLTSGISSDDIKYRKDSFRGVSLLQNPNITVLQAEPNGPTDIYTYLQYLKYDNGTLLINGKDCGKITPVEAKDGTLWPINHVLHKPTKTMMEALQEDGRFGMFLELNLRNDALYRELTFGIAPRDFTQDLVLAPSWANYSLTFTSIFAIPDAVFHAAGFQTVDDVMKLNDRNPLPTVDFDTYRPVGGLATDTLMGYSRWGVMFAFYDSYSGGGGQRNTNLNIYTPDLTNDILGNFTVVSSGLYGTFPPYTMPFDFGKQDGSVTVNVKGSNHPAAKITEGDINTLMGPIHVVDHFLVPKNFKF